MNIVNVGYDSTNYYVIGESTRRMLIDCGWPKTLPKFLAELKRKGIGLSEIQHLLITHYHPDHAGLMPELRNKGVNLLVLETQIAAITMQNIFMKPLEHLKEMNFNGILILTPQTSRSFLSSIGVFGVIINTPGHSGDSVSLVLDDGSAFTGDLTFPKWTSPEKMNQIESSWQAILALKAKMVYPGHGPTSPIETVIERP